jgi:translocator protein
MTRTFHFVTIFALLGTLVINALANILPINGMNTGQLSDLYPSLFTPAGFTFSIWSVIYLLLIGFAIVQFTVSEKPYFKELSLWFWLSCAANCAWILAWHYQFLFASLVIMLTLLYSLVNLFLIVQKDQHVTFLQKVFIQLPFVFYLAWICVATIANTSALLVSLSWDGGFLSPVMWTIIMTAIATALGIIIVWKYKTPAFLLVLIWALFGIYGKWNNTENSAIAIAALTEFIFLSIVFVFFVLRKARA